MSNQAHGNGGAQDLPCTETAYGTVFTWDEHRSKPQSNLAEFLKKLATDGELQERVKDTTSDTKAMEQPSLPNPPGLLQTMQLSAGRSGADDRGKYTGGAAPPSTP